MPCPLDRFANARAPYSLGPHPERRLCAIFCFPSGEAANYAVPDLYIRGEGASRSRGISLPASPPTAPKRHGARLQIVAANKNAGKHKTDGYTVEFRGFSWKIYAVTATRLPEALRSPRVRYSPSTKNHKPIRRAQRRFHRPLRMRHQPKHVAFAAANPRNRPQRPIRIIFTVELNGSRVPPTASAQFVPSGCT